MGDTMELVRFNADNAIEVGELTRQRLVRLRFDPPSPAPDAVSTLAVWMGSRAHGHVVRAESSERQGVSSLHRNSSLLTSLSSQNLYWLMPTSPSTFILPEVEMLSLEGKPGPPPASLSFRPLGHVSLDWVDYSGDDSLTSREGGLVTIATFFILQSQVRLRSL